MILDMRVSPFLSWSRLVLAWVGTQTLHLLQQLLEVVAFGNLGHLLGHLPRVNLNEKCVPRLQGLQVAQDGRILHQGEDVRQGGERLFQ